MPNPDSQLRDELIAAQACDAALLRTRTVCALTGLGQTQIRLLSKQGHLRPLKLAPRVLRFRAGDVKAWLVKQAEIVA